MTYDAEAGARELRRCLGYASGGDFQKRAKAALTHAYDAGAEEREQYISELEIKLRASKRLCDEHEGQVCELDERETAYRLQCDKLQKELTELKNERDRADATIRELVDQHSMPGAGVPPRYRDAWAAIWECLKKEKTMGDSNRLSKPEALKRIKQVVEDNFTRARSELLVSDLDVLYQLIEHPGRIVKTSQSKELRGRLFNWKFQSALSLIEGQPEDVQDDIKSLVTLYGQSGWFEGEAGVIVRMAVANLIGDTDD